MIISSPDKKSRLRIACFFAIGVFLLSFCKKKEEDFIYNIEVLPSNTALSYYENDIVNLRVNFTSSNTITRIKVSEKKTNSVTKYVLDTAVNFKNGALLWDYTFPTYTKDGANYYLDFDVIFSNGDVSTKRLAIVVKEKDVLLQEFTGNIFYSKKSGKQDGYDLIHLKPLYVSFAKPDDIISAKDTSNSNTLSKVWLSPSNGTFVRFNTFDYANATLAKTRQAYETGVKQEIVSQVQEGDVMIYYQHNLDQYRVIKVTGVEDLDSTQYDKYIFNVKKP